MRAAVEDIAVRVLIWTQRHEPDAQARLAAAEALGGLDQLVAAAYRIRARLTTQVRLSDRQAADRADALLARTREGGGRVDA
jgi:hypothetical protein